jgi:hypothetical protein
MRDLLGDLVIGALVEGGLSDFDVVGDGSHRFDTLGCWPMRSVRRCGHNEETATSEKANP